MRRVSTRRSSTSRVLPIILSAGVALGVGALTPACGLAVKPSHRQGSLATPANSVRFHLDAQEMQLAQGDASAVRFRVFGVDGSTRGAQQGDDAQFTLAAGGASQDFKLTKLTLGLKEFQVDVLSGNGDVLGAGTLRLLVGMGEQTVTEPLVIHLVAPADRHRDLDVAVTVRITAADSGPTTSYADIQPIIAASCSLYCHNPAYPASGLKIDTFPFTWVQSSDQSVIVQRMIARMRGSDDPPKPIMPPAGKLPEAQLALFDSWLAAGLPVTPPAGPGDLNALVKGVRVSCRLASDAPGAWTTLDMAVKDDNLHYGVQMPAMQVGSHYLAKFQVLGPDGVILGEDGPYDLLVNADGGFSQAIDIVYHAPSVEIPIVVQGP